MQLKSRFATFPFRLFVIFVLFYSGQAIYNTYLNLYLVEQGLTTAQIGMTVSVSTLFVLGAQLLWGVASDRARTKNSILLILYLGAAVVALLFYAGTSYGYLLMVVALFAVFFNPTIPLQDNFLLETLSRSRWDYGQVRLGGTAGYCVTVLVIGFVLRDAYDRIFWMVALALIGCFLLALGLPKKPGYRNRQQKTPFRALLSNKPLVGLVAFNLASSVGLTYFYSFYPIYFTSVLGADSGWVGTMMFACAASEIPILLIINRVVKRIGVEKTVMIAGSAACLRWFLLFVLREPALIVAANLLHGVAYIGVSYCVITTISATVPKDLQATSQTINALVGSVISRALFGYLGGLATQWLGAQVILLFCGCLMAVATVVFAIWTSRRRGIAIVSGE